MSCPASINLRDYGLTRCREQLGHDGPHVTVSPYDSRHIKWRGDDTPSRTHVFTDAELRARDERIIRTMALWHIGDHFHMSKRAIDAIIAAAKVDL